MRFPESVLLEHGRRLVEQDRWQDGRISLEAPVNGHPTSPLATEERYLAHRARFEHALDIADEEHFRFLYGILNRLGGTEPRPPRVAAP